MGNLSAAASRRSIDRIFEAASHIDRAVTARDIMGHLRSGIERYGYVACLITQLPQQKTGSLAEHILLNGWPAEWYRHYQAERHYRNDPCAALCRTGVGPFVWSDVRRRLTDPSARQVMDEAEEFGLRDGVCIPIQVPYGEPAAVTVAGTEIDLAPEARCSVHALSRHAYTAALRLAGNAGRAPEKRLSDREREILQWTAAGKTAWEVSVILGISESTVNTHLRNIRQKLNAANIAHAVVEAFRRHEIQL
ncbi:autoinducer binding domain-containing protein [Mesorhizobium sp. BR1-1-7]|uniref:autoinducer binding domain-containing protein n=1 Tax=Mesorhizobium sp. BR1-1-7 TaxID=2876647 RepID=UPI001CC92DF3|nr:autoinducer binding domain-containing protein [Mesorhizobium sp. BR1-1-7]MBZ9921929.1 autoinducer binding domain-containing protein [Mesorhizobium sp. BR1-1-7]